MANDKTPNYHWDIPNPYGLQIVEMIKVASTFGAIDSHFKAFEDAYQNHKHSFEQITQRPKTLSGYGITDALPLTGGILTGSLSLNSSLYVIGDGNRHLWLRKLDGTPQGLVYSDGNTGSMHFRTYSEDGSTYVNIGLSRDGKVMLPAYTPTSDYHAVTKKYADDQAAETVQVTTVQNFTLAQKSRARQNIDALGTVDRGAPNGVASLDAGGKIPSSQLPQAVLDADKTTLASVTSAMSQAPLGGDIDESNDRFFLLVNSGSSKRYGWATIKNWIKSWIAKSDVGLSNVDNTSDANKPVSTAQLTALNLKQNNLGFTPVEQGGFAGVGSNKIRIGWGTGAVLRLRVDASDYGQNWPIDIRGTANNADNFGSMSVATWQNFVQANSWPGVSWSDGTNEYNFPVGHMVLAGGNFSKTPNQTTPPRLEGGSGAGGYVSDSTSGASGRLNGTWKTRGGAGSAMLYQRVG